MALGRLSAHQFFACMKQLKYFWWRKTPSQINWRLGIGYFNKISHCKLNSVVCSLKISFCTAVCQGGYMLGFFYWIWRVLLSLIGFLFSEMVDSSLWIHEQKSLIRKCEVFVDFQGGFDRLFIGHEHAEKKKLFASNFLIHSPLMRRIVE